MVQRGLWGRLLAGTLAGQAARDLRHPLAVAEPQPQSPGLCDRSLQAPPES